MFENTLKLIKETAAPLHVCSAKPFPVQIIRSCNTEKNDTIFLKQFKYLNGLNYVAHLIAAGQVLELNSGRERNEKKQFSLTD